MSLSFVRGLVVGKFCPLHLGHESVIRRALECCGEVFVLSYTNPEFPGCQPARRRDWLAARFPGARSLVLESQDGLPPNDADDTTHRRFVACICREHFQQTVDAVFTSEAYGPGFAAELAAIFGHPVTHVMVDAARAIWPVSGTRLREDIHTHRSYLAPEVYASFVQRVAILGGESTGKTTLAAALAKRFDTVWVPEFGRELWEQKGGNLELCDMQSIIREQCAREELATKCANRFVFCDSTPLTTLFYCRDLFAAAPPGVAAAASRHYDWTILCAPDFAFVQDGTRRDDVFRHRQNQWYLSEFALRGIRFVSVHGSLEERLTQAARHLTDVFSVPANLRRG